MNFRALQQAVRCRKLLFVMEDAITDIFVALRK